MNVLELKNKWKVREVNDGEKVTVTGIVLDFWDRKEGTSAQGAWSFDPCKFGDPDEYIRLSFKNAPSDGSLQALKGQERTFSAEVGSYNGKPNLTVYNVLEQINTGPTVDEIDIRADMAQAEQRMAAPKPSGVSLDAYRSRRVRTVKFYLAALTALPVDEKDDVLRSAVALASGETIDLNKGVFVDSEPGDEDLPF